MEDYRLEQSGQEVQDILNGAAMQTDLTAETERATDAEQTLQGHIDDEELRAKGAESTLQDHIDDEAAARQGADSTLQDHIDAEETRAKAAEKQNADDIDLIEEKIPSGASSSNQLADKAFVNSSIATATATFRGTFNLVSDLHLTLEATEQQIATALAGAIATADNNDYAFVQIPTSDETPTQIAEIDRYKYNGSAWAFEYALNNSGFTAAQWAAINSTVTSGDMTKLRALPTNAELSTLLNGLQGGIDDEETRAKAAELALQGAIDDEETRAKGVELSLQGAIGDEETARQGADSTLQDNIDAEETRAKAAEKQNADDIDLIEEKIPSTASSSNQLATASDVSDLSAAIEAILLLIPSAASSLNQLADKAFVNSSIATDSATFRGTYNLVTDLGLTILATHAQIETALAGEISTADNNDYCFVQIPTSADTPTEIAKTERYKYNGSEWAYEYDLNNSGYTAAQWAAINSGITSALVTKLSALPTNAELTTALGALTDGIDTINEKIPSAASISNKLVDTSALESYVTQVINAIDATFNVTSTDGHVNVQITQVNGVITAVSVNTSDIASADALTVIGGRVTTAEGNITSLAGRVSTNETDIAQLQALYEALTESEPEIIQPTDTWPVASPSEGVIYRVVDRVNTPPEYYSDYMWNGTTMVLMATYDNAIDDEPTPGSNNLVKSGGVASNIVFDISRYHATGSTLATYADLAAALGTNGENVPADIRRGGMSIKFVHTDDNNYVQYRLMKDEWSTDTDDWSFCREIVLVENPEYIEVRVDSNDRIFEGITTNGTKEINLSTKISGSLNVDDGMTVAGDTTVDNISVNGDIETSAVLQQKIESPEYLKIIATSSDGIIEGLKKEGRKVINVPIDIPAVSFDTIESKEFFKFVSDNNGRMTLGINSKGQLICELAPDTSQFERNFRHFNNVFEILRQFKCNAVGDSITANDYLSGVKDLIDINYTNYGVGGCTICVNNSAPASVQGKSIVERVCGLNGNTAIPDADVWFVMGGLNDNIYHSTIGELLPYGSEFDITTLYGAMQKTVEHILSKGTSYLFLLEPTQSTRDESSAEEFPTTMKKIREVINKVGEYYSVPVLKTSLCGISSYNTNKTTADGVHLNSLGRYFLSRFLAKNLYYQILFN